MARRSGVVLEIDTLLLSCRVIGRTVETAMLACLCDEARRSGGARLTGMIVPTPKNIPVRDLFERHGFANVADGNEVTAWSLDLGEKTVGWPAWFRVTLRKGANAVAEHQV
jgi:predicted enzyme involved in methoxymalonyl-ACP biosynthesis